MRIVSIDQRSPEWLAWRRTGLGSSDAGIIENGKHFGRNLKHLWKEKRGTGKESKQNLAMKRGRDLEPVIIEMYEKLTGYKSVSICALHDRYDYIKASFDGWIADPGVVLEVKAPKVEDHMTALDGEVPTKYIPQCKHLLLVSGGIACHYVSYHDKMPRLQRLAIVHYEPPEGELIVLLNKEITFWEYVEKGIEPEIEG